MIGCSMFIVVIGYFVRITCYSDVGALSSSACLRFCISYYSFSGSLVVNV